MDAFRRFARWQLTPILMVALGNVLVWYSEQLGGCYPWVWLLPLLFLAVVAGAITPDGLLLFSALCMSIPVLTMRSRQHGALVDCLLGGFVNPALWVYFVMNFTPFYLGYVIVVRFGMTMRKAVATFKEGYSGMV